MKPAPGPRRRQYWTLLALAALFLSGIVVSFVLVEIGWRPRVTHNYGELVDPARPIRDVALLDLDGEPVRFSAFKGRWTLVYFGSAACAEACTADLYKMRQITAAQGTDAGRVRQVFVVTDPAGLDALRRTLADYPDIRVLRGRARAVRALGSQFTVPAGTALEGLDRVYLVDPLGNLMMSYPADADPSGMNKDLRLLLRASHIG